MKTKYLEFISESRYKTHGLPVVKRTIPKMLKSMNCIFNIDYSISDDFVIYFTNLTNGAKDAIISRCELLGYFPSVFSVDNNENRNKDINDIDDFVKYVKNYKLDTNNEVYIQFESWLDDIVETPKILYHVCRTIDVEKIERYGLSPRSKHKISYHPDRIYLVSDYLSAISIIKQFKEIEDIEYSIVKITPDTEQLNIRRDPNFDSGFYSTQNILPTWIDNIEPVKID
jgi:hypothetical protein